MYNWGVVMKKVLLLLLLVMLLVACGEDPDYASGEGELDFFYDKWWELGDNPIIDENSCYMLYKRTGNFLSRDPTDDQNVGHILTDWTQHDDYVSLNNLYGLYLELRFHTEGEEIFVTVNVNNISKETNLYNCDF